VVLSRPWHMANVRRCQFIYELLCTCFSTDPLRAASEILEKATSPGSISAPEINAAVLDVCYGKEHYTKAYGAAGTPQRVFVIASMSKPIVATAAMVLKDRGNLALKDRVVKFVPEFRGQGRDEVTIQHLLTHTAGLPDALPQKPDNCWPSEPDWKSSLRRLATFRCSSRREPPFRIPTLVFSW